MVFDLIEKHCPVFFFANFCFILKKNLKQKTRRRSLHSFIQSVNKRNRFSSLFRKINRAGNLKFNMNNNGIFNLFCTKVICVRRRGTLGWASGNSLRKVPGSMRARFFFYLFFFFLVSRVWVYFFLLPVWSSFTPKKRSQMRQRMGLENVGGLKPKPRFLFFWVLFFG